VSDPTTVCADTRHLHHSSAETASTNKVEKAYRRWPGFFQAEMVKHVFRKEKEIGH
jgi:hypothetical protein